MDKIRVENGRATGVVLENAEEISARTMVSAINPSTTFLDLVGPRELDTGFVRKVKNIRNQGDAAKLHLALDRPPEFLRRRRRRPSRPPGHRALARPCRARLQPVQVWRVLARAGDGDYAAQPRRPVARARRRLRAFGGGAVRALRAQARLGVRKAEIPQGDNGAARNLCARHRQDHPPCRAPDARPTSRRATACPAAIGTTENCRRTRC